MAVYTEVSDNELVAFLAGYALGEAISCKGIAEGIENSNYLLATSTGTYILTLYEKRVKPGELPFFLSLMDHLARQGVPCPTPVKDWEGRALRTLCGRPAAIVTFLPGMWPRRVTPEHCSNLGEALAHMHLAGHDFSMQRTNDLSVQGWRPLLEAAGPDVDTVRPGLAAELGREIGELERDWPRNLPQGVIHADLFPDNVFFRGDRLSGIIDFYFACTDSLVYDIAICLNAWCFEPDLSLNVTKARRLVAGYRRVRRISEDETAALPVLARGAAMRFLLTRLYDWLHTPKDALVTRKDPIEYLEKSRFHRKARGLGDYGLA